MSRRLPEFLRPNESSALVGAASMRDRVILLCGLGAGLRCNEIVCLRVEDVSFADATLFVRQGKGKKDRYVCLPPFLIEALRNWIGARQGGWVFPSPYRPARHLTTRAVRYLAGRLRTAAGLLRRANPHVWRHSYACDLLRSGADIAEISQLLGHSSIAVTAIYLHCDSERLKPAVARLTDPTTSDKAQSSSSIQILPPLTQTV